MIKEQKRKNARKKIGKKLTNWESKTQFKNKASKMERQKEVRQKQIKQERMTATKEKERKYNRNNYWNKSQKQE